MELQGMCHSFGDRYCLLFDFEAKKVSVFYNDIFVGMMHDNLPDKVVPAMSFLTDSDTKAMAKCTKWEIVF